MSKKRLPIGALAWVEEKKICRYLLNLEHEQGGTKAKFFLTRGFTVEHWEEMSKALVTQATTNPLARTIETEFGSRHTVDCNCPTPDALDPCIRTVWEVGDDDVRPRLITAHPFD